MSISEFPIFDFPTNSVTDPNVVYSALGSFWNQIFQDQATLKGYTTGQAEEMTQRYLDLVETIHSYSIRDIPIFHRERWYPIIIKKSQYNNIPLIFRASTDPEKAIYGPQVHIDGGDNFYEQAVFQFGFPKIPVAKVFTFATPPELKRFTVITNRILNPSYVLVNDVDIKFTGDTIYFNKDIFASDLIPKVDLIDDSGVPATFVDSNGVTQNDQLIILWAYHVDTDQDILFENFGYAFDLRLTNDAFYKALLQKIVDLFAEGPTVRSIRSLACAFLGVTPIIEPVERVEETYVIDSTRLVITDKHVYKFDIYYSLASGVGVGSILHAGDVLANAAEYFDYNTSGRWWRENLVPQSGYDAGVIAKYPQMNFPNHLFLGDYRGQFVVNNDYELVTRDAGGYIRFPIHGLADDVQKFNDHLNLNAAYIAGQLGLAVSSSVVINPLDFFFDNFLKHNTVLIKFNFKDIDQAQLFTSFFDVIKNMLPKHVYFIFYLDFTFPSEVYDQLNTADGNADGSNTLGKCLPAGGVLHANLATDLFTASTKYVNQSLSSVVDIWQINADPHVVGLRRLGGIKDGAMQTTIGAGLSMKDVSNLVLLDFT